MVTTFFTMKISYSGVGFYWPVHQNIEYNRRFLLEMKQKETVDWCIVILIHGSKVIQIVLAETRSLFRLIIFSKSISPP